MTPLGACSALLPTVLAVTSLVLMGLAAWLTVASFTQRRGTARVVGTVLSLLWTTLLTHAFAMLLRFEMRSGYSLVGLSWVLARCPALLSVALVAATGVVLAVAAAWLRASMGRQVTPDAVKEALDALPDAVCFSTSAGRPLLFNIQMDALAHDAFGAALSDERKLWERLCAGDVAAGYEVRDADAARGHALLLAADGGAWELRRRVLEVEGRAVVETIAADVTDEYGLAAVVAQRNARLAQVNESLRAYGADIARLVRDEEILAAKIHVHDEIGRALVALRAYEAQDPATRDRERLVAQWRGMTDLLRSAATDEEPAADEWAQLMDAARAVDVELRLEGVLPDAGEARRASIALVHECLTNAVRHAGAHELLVRAVRTGTDVAVCVTNDGAPPAAPGVETGGLADVRALVERAGGTMHVQWMPRFAATARFGGGED